MAYQFGMATMIYGGQEIGCLQGVTVDFNFDIAELFCGSGLYPVDVRVHTGRINGNCEFADLTAAAFELILGASRVNDTVTIDNTSAPAVFQLKCTVITDGITFQIIFNAVRSSKLSMAFVRDGHLIPNFDFQIQADASGNVGTIDIGDVS